VKGRLIVVDVLRSSAAANAILGAIEGPRAGVETQDDTLDLVGWAGGVARAARAVEVVSGRTVVARAPLEIERPDVAAQFPEMPGDRRAGFRAKVSTLGFAEMDLRVDVVLDDGSRHLLGIVRAQRDWAPEPTVGEADLVSLIVLVREQAQPLVETLESVVPQTYAAFDVTLVGATDQAPIVEAAGRYPGVQIAPRRSGSRAEAWNAGLDATRGDYVVFLPAGSRLTPGALAAGVRALVAYPSWGFVAGGQTSNGVRWKDNSNDGLGYGLLRLLRDRSVGTGATVVYRRSAVEAVGGFDERLLAEEHYDMALRIARRHPVGRHAEPVLEDDEIETPPVGGVCFGGLRRVTPFSHAFGAHRGLPIDRYYVEGFLARHSDDVRGRVLEISAPVYTRRFGADRVTHGDVLSLTEGNPAATIIGDLADAPQLLDASFDCIIVTQTLHLIHDVGAAIDTVFRTLRPGGVVLATVPGITQLDRVETWHWSLTPASATRLFTDRFGAGNIAVEDHGNVLAATAFLFGLAAEELTIDELDHHDRDYPVTVAVRAVRPAHDR